MAKSDAQEHVGPDAPHAGAGKPPAGKVPPIPPAGPHDAPEPIDPLATPGTGVLPPIAPEDDIDVVSS